MIVTPHSSHHGPNPPSMERRLALCVALLGLSGVQAQHTDRVQFRTASAELTPDQLETLDALCERMAAEGTRTVLITGHTDNRGDHAYNAELSRKRAQHVRDHLRQCALADVYFDESWNGEDMPLATGSEAVPLAANRRVEITLVPTGRAVQWNGGTGPSTAFTPLIPAAAVDFQRTTVDASQPITWTSAEGITVRIPANAIVDADGRPVSGLVDLDMRTFKNAWETVASGIPMHIRTADGTQHFESAFMVELLASQQGVPLELKAGERIAYELPAGQEIAPDFASFDIDPATGEWRTGAGLDASPGTTQVDSNATVAVQRYMRRYAAAYDRGDEDTTRFQDRMTRPQFCYTTACQPQSKPYRRHHAKLMSPYGPGIPAITVQMLPGKQRYHGHTGFRLHFGNGGKDHPEWRAFPRGMWWGYSGDLTQKAFREEVSRKHFYQDARLTRDERTGAMSIWLKDRGRWKEFPVTVDLAEASLNGKDDLSACMDHYDKAFAAKREKFNARVEREAVRVRASEAQARVRAYADAERLMTATERDMARTAFHAYAETEHARSMVHVGRTDATVENVLLYSAGFGLCNIDRMISGKPQEMIARFQNGNAPPFRWITAYAIREERNAVLTLWGTGNEVQRLDVAPGRMDWLILSDGKGGLALVDGKDLRSSSTAITLPYRRLSQDFTMADLQAVAQR